MVSIGVLAFAVMVGCPSGARPSASSATGAEDEARGGPRSDVSGHAAEAHERHGLEARVLGRPPFPAPPAEALDVGALELLADEYGLGHDGRAR